MSISRNASLAPCHRTKNKAFIDPSRAQSFQVNAAQQMCQHCPLLQECAVKALTLGSTITMGRVYPADGVIMAGVICRGDTDTAEDLARIAGVPAPKFIDRNRRSTVPDHCRECGVPMVKFTRNQHEIPEGFTMHHARGFCQSCRAAYRQFMETVTDKRVTRAVEKRPSHCRACQLPMVPVGTVPPVGHVEHHGRGLCQQCGVPTDYTTTSRSAPDCA